MIALDKYIKLIVDNQMAKLKVMNKNMRDYIGFPRVPVILKIYISCMLLHYVSAMLYNQWCVPKTFSDILWLPLLFHSPQCKILQWGFTTSSGIINQVIITVITWLITYTTKISTFNVESRNVEE